MAGHIKVAVMVMPGQCLRESEGITNWRHHAILWPFIKAMEAFATSTGLLPEQVWALPSLPQAHMTFGRATGVRCLWYGLMPSICNSYDLQPMERFLA